MKIAYKIIIIFSLLLLTSCKNDSGNANKETIKESTKESVSESLNEKDKKKEEILSANMFKNLPKVEIGDEIKLSKSSVVIKGAKLSKDVEENPVVLIIFDWKNLSNEKKSIKLTSSIEVIQNLHGTKSAPFLKDTGVYDLLDKKVDSGESIKNAESPHQLYNTEDPIVLEITDSNYMDEISFKKFILYMDINNLEKN